MALTDELTPRTDMEILIIGAGIGGLATALSLQTAGFTHVTVAERSEQIRGLGVGINLLPMQFVSSPSLASRIASQLSVWLQAPSATTTDSGN